MDYVTEIVAIAFSITTSIAWYLERRARLRVQAAIKELAIRIVVDTARKSAFARRQAKQALDLKVDDMVKQLEPLNVPGAKKREAVIVAARQKFAEVGTQVIDQAIEEALKRIRMPKPPEPAESES